MNIPSRKKPQPSSQSAQLLIYALGFIALLFATFGFLLWKSGLLTFTGTDPGSKPIAAALALAGALVGSLVSIIGIVLKHSLDLRTAALSEQTERRLAIDGQRTIDLQSEAENRLKLEAAIEAAKLLGTNSSAGALFALSSLGMHDLATVLTRYLLATDQLDADIAASLLNRTLKSGEERLQAEVATILEDYASKFLMPGGSATFPECFQDFDAKLPPLIRYHGAIALGRLLAARPYAEWDESVVVSIIASFCKGWTMESDKSVKNEVGACLKSTLGVLPKVSIIYYDPKGEVDIEKVSSEVKDLVAEISLTQQLIAKLDVWVKQASGNQHSGDSTPLPPAPPPATKSS
jgi:hypothetical protein